MLTQTVLLVHCGTSRVCTWYLVPGMYYRIRYVRVSKVCRGSVESLSELRPQQQKAQPTTYDRTHDTRTPLTCRCAYLSKWLRAASTVSLANSYDADTFANQSTTALRITKKSASREKTYRYQVSGINHTAAAAAAAAAEYSSSKQQQTAEAERRRSGMSIDADKCNTLLILLI